MEWVKSSFSFANGNCIEVKRIDTGLIVLRNSRSPWREISCTTGEFAAFVAGVNAGEFARMTMGGGDG